MSLRIRRYLVEAGKPVGKIQQAIMKIISHETWVSVSDVARHKELATLHYKKIMSAVSALVKKGLIKSKDDPRVDNLLLLLESVSHYLKLPFL